MPESLIPSPGCPAGSIGLAKEIWLDRFFDQLDSHGRATTAYRQNSEYAEGMYSWGLKDFPDDPEAAADHVFKRAVADEATLTDLFG